MAHQISLFNHKGGVSKTTTVFNLGWMLCNKGKKVIIVDCDPQCNLTGMVLGFRGSKEFNEIYKAPGIKSIKDGLSPAFESKPKEIEPVDCVQITGQPNLHLLPGHIGLAEYEVTLGIAQELSGSIVTLQNLPGSVHHLLQITAKKYKADYVLIDMNPSLGPINQNLLMTSDYFIIPMAPDFFSVMATDSLASVIPKWKKWAERAQKTPQLKEATYPFPNKTPKLLGTIIQKYRIRAKNTPSEAFKAWLDEIERGLGATLLPVLEDIGMMLPRALYKKAGFEPEKPLLQMSDFNGLIAQSQKYKVPIFQLSDAQLEQSGIVLKRTKKSMEKFQGLYSEGADRVINLIDYAHGI